MPAGAPALYPVASQEDPRCLKIKGKNPHVQGREALMRALPPTFRDEAGLRPRRNPTQEGASIREGRSGQRQEPKLNSNHCQRLTASSAESPCWFCLNCRQSQGSCSKRSTWVFGLQCWPRELLHCSQQQWHHGWWLCRFESKRSSLQSALSYQTASRGRTWRPSAPP